MVQRKVPNKLGIKPIHLKSDAKLVSLKPSSPQTHEKLNKIMKKSRPIKRTDESRSLPPFKKKQTQPLHNYQTPNYMKSTSCFEARKEQSPKTPTPTQTPKASKNPKANGSKASSLKMVRSLTKTTSFKPSRPSKKVVICEDLDANRATCSSTLKESKFPSYLELGPGGTELDGSSAIKVCPYTYCSLNGHHHAPVPPLKCFLSARRRAMKSQKSFKLGCLSPRAKTPVLTKPDIKEVEIMEEVDMNNTRVIEEDEKSRDFFVEDVDWEEGYCSASCNDDDICEEKIQKTVDESVDDKLYGELQELYDEESVTSGAWSEEDGDSESDSSYSFQQMEINQEFMKYDSSDVSSTATDTYTGINGKNDEFEGFEGFNLPIGDQNINYSIDYQQEEFPQESKTAPDFGKDGSEKNHTTIIYNIIQFNISVFINGVKTEHSEMDKIVTHVAENKTEKEEIIEEQGKSNVFDEEIYKETSESDEEQTNSTGEITSDKDTNTNSIDFNEENPDSCMNPNGLTTRVKKSGEETDDDSPEFNPRGPNFLPEVVGPDAETVDLRHQDIDERKNAEEWMVDFALQQAVNTIAPKRKKKVALLVEAFEKVMPPVPKYESSNRYSSKTFMNARPMQACS